ncbi:MAG: bifunctional 3-deoxy-7-phosphoheptulonate synthase/chorismate mutase type II [Paludibacteraceae bacterium]|nr:bifunctional 3-deoxy-7-phosphoheptulonate synthase/chorismate mutase type II [Paludibacteraceae bacterium]
MTIDQRLYILGPCAAESREQVLETARRIQAACGEMPFIFRAGVWKPRTSPYTFQGAGIEALSWLQEVKTQFGVPVATEVATREHVEAALQAGIDYLWIGARSSATPIVVQTLADSIAEQQSNNSKLNIPNTLKGILIKNPVNADAALWIGNIERLEKTGVPVIAVHRGCNHRPCWSMAHTVRNARPDIPMLLDPSHMSGKAAKVPELMEKIETLALDGAMVEVHCCPEQALSDRKQQITPEKISDFRFQNSEFFSRFARTIIRRANFQSSELELNWLRAEIDELDEELWDTIAARMDVSKRIGEWKKEHGIAPLQPERYQQIVKELKIKNEKLRMNGLPLSEQFMLNIWEMIHEESLRQQS